eukprot:TRINITY_DN18964_c0_g1_i10.p1 TRINITY_DN18964_c0_g1~~TRINITY_DN18964_c0_g1_i10.p1  ORF type:complete len:357 (-),score=60.89 TRINITY_DN18964_c0_g1_i10:152-1183(-)
MHFAKIRTHLLPAVRISQTNRLFLSSYPEFEEIRIPVPYGHIAGKAWGNPDGKPILGLHGWLDNAGTHDRLIQHLAPGYRFIALDQPGHGRSSHYPPGMQYKMSDAFTFIRQVLDHLKWDKCCIVGHSLGAGMGMWYSALFPEQIEKVVAIDLASFGSMSLQKHVSVSRKSVKIAVDMHKKLASGGKIPYYNFEDSCGRAFMAANVLGGLGSITKESVEILMKRGLVKHPEKEDLYTWSADLRLRIPTTFNMVQEVAEEYGSKISCPHLLIKAKDSSKYTTDENFERILKVYRNHNPNFIYREFEGGHHLHLNTPELIAPTINKFLEKDFADPEPEKSQFDMI